MTSTSLYQNIYQPAALGIDPGKDGGIALLGRGRKLLHAERTTDRCLQGKEYNEDAILTLLQEMREKCFLRLYEVSLVILEKQHAMPKQGVSSTLAIGIGYGIWRGLLAGLGFPREIVRAVDWQREIVSGQPGDPKTKAILTAQRAIPELNLRPGKLRKPHTGLADAACMAIYGLHRLGEGP